MRIYDGNNQSRIIWETDTTGRPMKSIQDEANIPGETRIYVWDGINANARRRAIFDGYKSKRKAAPDEFYKTIEQIKRMLVHTSAIQCEVPGYEADDVIAKIVVDWNRNENVHILSTDRDLQPLRALRNVTTSQTAQLGVMPEDVRLYKTFVGDSSDSIPGVPGFGKKAWEEADKAKLYALMRNEIMPGMCGLSPRVTNWLRVDENRKVLQSMWDCIGLLDIPEETILRHLKPGKRNDAAAAVILTEFFQ